MCEQQSCIENYDEMRHVCIAILSMVNLLHVRSSVLCQNIYINKRVVIAMANGDNSCIQRDNSITITAAFKKKKNDNNLK